MRTSRLGGGDRASLPLPSEADAAIDDDGDRHQHGRDEILIRLARFITQRLRPHEWLEGATSGARSPRDARLLARRSHF